MERWIHCYGKLYLPRWFNFCLDRAETPERPPAESLHALTVLRKDDGYEYPSTQDWARLTHLCAKLADFLHSSFPGFSRVKMQICHSASPIFLRRQFGTYLFPK